MKQLISKYPVHSFMTSSGNWVIAKYDDGSYSCNCPAWIFHKGHKVDCKHILAFKRLECSLTLRVQNLIVGNETNSEVEEKHLTEFLNSSPDTLLSQNGKIEAQKQRIAMKNEPSNDISLTKIGQFIEESEK